MKNDRIYLRASADEKARWAAVAVANDFKDLAAFIRYCVEDRIHILERADELRQGLKTITEVGQDPDHAAWNTPDGEPPKGSSLWVPTEVRIGPPGQGAVVNPQQVKPCSRFFLHVPGTKCPECGQ